MGFLVVLGIAFGLAMDALAVALGISFALRRVSARQVFRLSFHFGLFQALMPVIGWAAGATASHWMSGYDHWIAMALLGYVGVQMIRASLGPEEDAASRDDPTRGARLIMLSIATSIDALAVGLSLGVMRVAIWYPSLVIGVVAAACTMAGMLAGQRFGHHLGRRMELVGGVVLLLIGARIVWMHVVGGTGL